MEVYGKMYRTGNEDRWICISEMPEIFNKIDIDDEDHQISVVEKMLDWLSKFKLYEKALKIESFLAPDIIYIVVEFVDKEGCLSKLILWGKTDRPLNRKDGMEFWSDVNRTAGVSLGDKR